MESQFSVPFTQVKAIQPWWSDNPDKSAHQPGTFEHPPKMASIPMMWRREVGQDRRISL
jgi:hypothetical protein